MLGRKLAFPSDWDEGVREELRRHRRRWQIEKMKFITTSSVHEIGTQQMSSGVRLLDCLPTHGQRSLKGKHRLGMVSLT